VHRIVLCTFFPEHRCSLSQPDIDLIAMASNPTPTSIPTYPDKPSKRIVLCCDGTWDDSDGTLLPPTNVTKIARSIRRQAKLADGTTIPQIVFYQSGIGAKSPNKEAHALDGLTGRGMFLHSKPEMELVLKPRPRYQRKRPTSIWLPMQQLFVGR